MGSDTSNPATGRTGDARPTLVYDADCGFCTRCARWIEGHLRAGSPLHVVPWQAVDLEAFGLTPEDTMAAAWYVDEDGSRERGHLAIAAGLRAVGGVWGGAGRVLAGRVMSRPAAIAYSWVARNRHRMPGGSPACKVDE